MVWRDGHELYASTYYFFMKIIIHNAHIWMAWFPNGLRDGPWNYKSSWTITCMTYSCISIIDICDESTYFWLDRLCRDQKESL